MGAQWLSGRVLDSRPRGRWFEPHWRHCAVSLRKNINPNLVMVQPRKTGPYMTERLLMGRKESNQTKQNLVETDRCLCKQRRPRSGSSCKSCLIRVYSSCLKKYCIFDPTQVDLRSNFFVLCTNINKRLN